MSEWDTGSISFSSQRLGSSRDLSSRDSLTVARREFRAFVRGFREGEFFLYREQLIRQYRRAEPWLQVDMRHLSSYSKQLHDLIRDAPNDYIPVFESSIKDTLKELIGEGLPASGEDADPDVASAVAASSDAAPDFQLSLVSDMAPTRIRSITAAHMNKLVVVPGIVVNASRTAPKATRVALRCRNCGSRIFAPVSPAFGGFSIPRRCNALRADAGDGDGAPGDQPCPLDPFVVVPDHSAYTDAQTLKLQEAPEDVPTGEMPRHVIVAAEQSLVDRVAPGARVRIVGVASIFTAKAPRASRGSSQAVRTPYVRAVGLLQEDDSGTRGAPAFSAEEEEELRAMAAEPGLYDRLWPSVAPAISGEYTNDIKKAVLCLLMGGSRKLLPDGTRLRGDINVLMLGDPSTAKSQFLKFVERVAPVGVYTSGKGSSAAGLTASVVRDQRGEFYLEGGAMVLGDGGVVCIDEFDKMREEDRVAIHEAMEQQTISVAKAGITTVLNSRTAVLAAANPVFGRYDDSMSAAENIDFMPTILSRFDLIFIVRDVRDAKRDEDIARHVMRIHINAAAAAADEEAGVGGGAAEEESDGEMGLHRMRRFIAFAKSRVAPRLSAEAMDRLREFYVQMRREQRALKTAAAASAVDAGNSHQRAAARAEGHEAASVVPITVRQLEALVRVSEAVAKSELATHATVDHADEAIRLFRQSTLAAAKSGVVSAEGGLPAHLQRKARDVEAAIQRALPLGSEPMALERLRKSIANPDTNVFRWVLSTMKRRDELVEVDEGRRVRRNK
ncbi:hypothetical protein FNF27_04605 [Cafeteria roenbergensis]|nr:hypothetical protein FNF28_05080 [Cafeteria roenbergensis]KAA0163086.1 hypothetical protein FNF31_02909 [Cafeteria roenbergensis]KAA0173848.1 hypothetical protein FNF27_04605 [Cafeteria roenbergensis]